MATSTLTDRYTIISSDCHAGGNHAQYREYLDPAYVERFDEWRGRYKNPFRDLQDDGRSRNWDDERRISEMEADGVVAEVVFPNTVPPFFPTGVVIAPAPTTPEDYELRLAGIRAHNRWLADFCAAHPERRAGLGQILLNDVDDTLEDIERDYFRAIERFLDHGAGDCVLKRPEIAGVVASALGLGTSRLNEVLVTVRRELDGIAALLAEAGR